MSSPPICSSQYQDLVPNDDEKTNTQSREHAYYKGSRISLKRMRETTNGKQLMGGRERPNLSSLSSYDKAALESIKMWETTNGKLLMGRRERPNLNSLSSYDKAAIESIMMWKTTNGKRALLCAVTYNNQKYKQGTNYDVKKMECLLISRFHFPQSSILILAEMDSYPHPTKRNIQEALRWLVKDNRPGDSLVFYFSGHGLRQPGFFDDKFDGFGESICPVDFRTAGMIVANEINDTIVRPLKTGVKLHAIIDACHIGTINDACHIGTILNLRHVYSTKEKRWLNNSPPSSVYKGSSGGQAISISACEDNPLAAATSAFSESGNQMEGVMTFTFTKALTENSRVTYFSLLASMHKDILEAKAKRFSLRGLFSRERPKVPLLSAAKVFDVNEPFVL